MMLDLNDFYYFVQVVDRGGITSASRSLSIPKSTLSFRIIQLEASLGTRLINRTSRHFCMTEAGREFYELATPMLKQAQAAEMSVRQRIEQPTGSIRIAAAVATAQFAISKVLPGFLKKYEGANVIQHVSDASVDVMAGNYDLAIRAHSADLPDSNLVKRPLGRAPWRLFASAAYVDVNGMPETPDDLSSHNGLFMSRRASEPLWQLKHATGEERTVAFRPRFITDDPVGLKAAALEGLGIVALPAYICKDDVKRGWMREVLPIWSAGESTLTALFATKLGLLPAARVFLDYLVEEMPKVLET